MHEKKSGSAFTGLIIALLSIMLCYPVFKSNLHLYSDFSSMSDVLPQLISQYQAFSRGSFPYFPLMKYGWHPYPVYMPLHWLPIGLGTLLNIDPRWIGFIFIAVAAGIYGYYIGQKRIGLVKKVAAISFPAIILYLSLLLNGKDYACTFETVVAAYYLLLAAGLSQKNLVLTATGIICCLLSRYTLAFWLPLFLILLWFSTRLRNNILVWVSLILSVLFLYVLPFYAKDPSILSKGLGYHRFAVLGEWKGYAATPRTSYTFDSGINFALFFYKIFPGDMEHKVFLARVVQGTCMLLLFFSGLFMYNRWRKKISFYDFSLLMLYLFLLFFFMFGPLTYKYYYLPLMMISAVICSKIILLEKRHPQ